MPNAETDMQERFATAHELADWLRETSPLDAPGGAFSQLMRDALASPSMRFEKSGHSVIVRHSVKGPIEDRPTTDTHRLLFDRIPEGSIVWDPHLDRHLSHLRAVAVAKGLVETKASTPNAIIRCVPTGLVNGAAWAAADGVLIAIDDGLIFAVAHLMDVAVRFVPTTPAGDHPEREPEATREAEPERPPERATVLGDYAAQVARLAPDNRDYAELRAVLRATLIYHNPMLALGSLVKGHEAFLSRVFRDIAEQFVVGHELGHLLLGHLHGAPFARQRQLAPDISVPEAAVEWTQELDADRVGLQLALANQLAHAEETGDVDNLVSGYWAIGLLFGLISIMEEVFSPPPTHPPARARHEALAAFLSERHHAGRMFDQPEACEIEMWDYGWWLARELWTRVRPQFEEDRRNPRPPVADVMRYAQLLRLGLAERELSDHEWRDFMRILGEEEP